MGRGVGGWVGDVYLRQNHCRITKYTLNTWLMYLHVCEHQGDKKINILLYCKQLNVDKMPEAFGGCPLPCPYLS